MKSNVFETSISDHHKMISTIRKLHFTKQSPKTKYYQDYPKFDIDYFSSEFSRQLNSVFCSIKENVASEELNYFSRFQIVFLTLLNIQAPLQRNIMRGNDSPFVTEILRKVIMIRSRLKNRFHKARSDKNWLLYKTQRNLCAKLLRRLKKAISKVNPKLISGNKCFRGTIKLYFSYKGKFSNKIIISEKDCIVFDDRSLSEIFNEHFINITKTSDLNPRSYLLLQVFLKLLKLLTLIRLVFLKVVLHG